MSCFFSPFFSPLFARHVGTFWRGKILICIIIGNSFLESKRIGYILHTFCFWVHQHKSKNESSPCYYPSFKIKWRSEMVQSGTNNWTVHKGLSMTSYSINLLLYYSPHAQREWGHVPWGLSSEADAFSRQLRVYLFLFKSIYISSFQTPWESSPQFKKTKTNTKNTSKLKTPRKQHFSNEGSTKANKTKQDQLECSANLVLGWHS